MNRPETTLFLIMSLDGKISSGDTDNLDVDQDWKSIHGVKEGLHQYYELEQQTDPCFFISGKVLAKVGINKKEPAKKPIPVTGVILDNKKHLNKQGINYLSSWLERVIIITTSSDHPAKMIYNNVSVIEYQNTIDFSDLFKQLKNNHEINRLTIQSGGTLNTTLLREGLIDHVSVVIAPILVGGSTTPTLLDGEAIHAVEELTNLRALRLKECNQLENSFLHLVYDVINNTTVD